MKKNHFFVSILVMVCCICPCIAKASDMGVDIPLENASLLENYSEKQDIQDLESEILAMADCFQGDGFYAEPSDIRFSEAYCVYVNTDVLKNIPSNKRELEAVLETSDLVWNIPITANNKTVIVQVSKALELSRINQSELTSDEIETVKSKEGKWQVVSASIYDSNETPIDNLKSALVSNSKDSNQCKCIIVGGEQGVYTMIAVLLENENILGAMSLERDINFENPAVKSAGDSILRKNTLYTLEQFSSASNSFNATDDVKKDITTGDAVNVTQYNCISESVLCGIMICIFILACIGVVYMMCRKRKKYAN